MSSNTAMSPSSGGPCRRSTLPVTRSRQETSTAHTAPRSVLAAPDSGSRDCLQAWHQLRALGEVPDDPACLYGVVVDMPVRADADMDTLAVYQDGTARYLDYSGNVLVWDASHPQVDSLIRSVIEVGAEIAAQIGPWEGPRPALRPGMLCAGGLRFGEGPRAALSADPMAGALLLAAAHLLQTLIDVDEGSSHTI